MPVTKPIRGLQLNKTHALARGLVGIWLMNEGSGDKIFDLSGNNNDGTFVGNTSWTTGEYGHALNLPGTNDNVTVADNPLLHFDGAFTLVGSGKPTNVDRSEYLIWKGATATDLITLGKSSSAGGKWVFHTYVDGVQGMIRPATRTPTAEDHQLVGTRDDNGVMRLYLDGIAFSDTDTQPGTVNTADAMYLGAGVNGVNGEWMGLIDYIYIYNRVLIAYEIALLNREPFCMFEIKGKPQLFVVVVTAVDERARQHIGFRPINGANRLRGLRKNALY